MIMQKGKVVESGAARPVLTDPQHPYSRQLKDAVLSPALAGAGDGANGRSAPDRSTPREEERNRMRKASVLLDRDFAIGDTDPRLFGAFVEHLGRCVYGGIYEPGHPTADENGFRSDVLALVRELGPTIMRYPGGNFVSGYNWEDGVGPVEARARRGSTSPGSRPSRTPSAPTSSSTGAAPPRSSRCSPSTSARAPATRRATSSNTATIPAAPTMSDLRRSHGYEEPHGDQVLVPRQRDGWPLADGPQDRDRVRPRRQGGGEDDALDRPDASSLPPAGPPAATCRPSGAGRTRCSSTPSSTSTTSRCTPTSTTTRQTRADFLASPDLMDMFIDEVVAIADAVAARRRSTKRIMLSFDEWNVWYRTRRTRADRVKEGWPIAPPILEEIYTMEDALAFGGACISLLNHADRVKAACLAQLVNVIAPIMTETGGPAWRQTIFYPFAQMSRLGRGRVLRAQVECETYGATYYDPRGPQDLDLPDPGGALPQARRGGERGSGGLTLFALNRDLEQAMEVSRRGARLWQARGRRGLAASRR